MYSQHATETFTGYFHNVYAFNYIFPILYAIIKNKRDKILLLSSNNLTLNNPMYLK